MVKTGEWRGVALMALVVLAVSSLMALAVRAPLPSVGSAIKQEPAVSAPPVVKARTPTRVQATKVWIVYEGQTLTELAVKFDTTVSHLVKLNGISNPNVILVGQRLRVK